MPNLEQASWLLFWAQAAEVTGYSVALLRKLAECGTLAVVRPKGAGQAKLRKRQLADLLEVDLRGQMAEFGREPLLLTPKAVCRWTGYSEHTLDRIARAGGLRRVVLPGGERATRYHKREVAALLWLEEWV